MMSMTGKMLDSQGNAAPSDCYHADACPGWGGEFDESGQEPSAERCRTSVVKALGTAGESMGEIQRQELQQLLTRFQESDDDPWVAADELYERVGQLLVDSGRTVYVGGAMAPFIEVY